MIRLLERKGDLRVCKKRNKKIEISSIIAKLIKLFVSDINYVIKKNKKVNS